MEDFCGLLFFAAPVFAQERATAYDALRVVGKQLGRESVNRVISVTGVDGDPQPETWKVLLEDRRSRGGVREVEVAGRRVVSERARPMAGSFEGARIDTSRLNLDSSGAFSVASHTAEKSGTAFSTASYTLRTDEGGEPVWIVTLQNGSRPVGTIYIGANRGTVRRTEGMFAGATMKRHRNRRTVAHHAPMRVAFCGKRNRGSATVFMSRSTRRETRLSGSNGRSAILLTESKRNAALEDGNRALHSAQPHS